MLHLEIIVRGLLDMFANLAAVCSSIKQRPEDEHIQCSLQKARVLLRFPVHSRHPTINEQAIVDIRLSIVKRKCRRARPGF